MSNWQRHTDSINNIYKNNAQSVAFIKTGGNTAAIKAGITVIVCGKVIRFEADTAIIMPALVAGTDYAIYVCTDGSIRADASFSAPVGYSSLNSWNIGGFHYAPGGNAPAQAGGDAVPAINEYSFWDVKFRPACANPRGMALIAGLFWCDIYFLGIDYLINGSSKYNVVMASGANVAKRSTLFGGNGTDTYPDSSWFNLCEALTHCGKRCPSYDEFKALAYGTTEGISAGVRPATTGLNAAFTSKYGIMQVTGNIWIYGNDFAGPNATGWINNTGGRGNTNTLSNILILGSSWVDGINAGSRTGSWDGSIPTSSAYIAARGICKHLINI